MPRSHIGGEKDVSSSHARFRSHLNPVAEWPENPSERNVRCALSSVSFAVLSAAFIASCAAASPAAAQVQSVKRPAPQKGGIGKTSADKTPAARSVLTNRQKTIPVNVRKQIPGAVFVPMGDTGDSWKAAAVEIVAEGQGRINYAAGVIKSIGLGAIAPPSLTKSRSQDILDAREAAIGDAIRTLGLAVSQVRVTADTRVSNYILKNDLIRTRIEGVLRNATILEEKILPKSGVYRVVVQAQLTGQNSLLTAIEPAPSKIVPVVAFKTEPVERPAPAIVRPDPLAPGMPAPADAEYTSLIVDCRGLGVVSCMSPRVFDTDGGEVYGTMHVSPDYVVETGIAAFPRSLSAARRCSRAGEHPLVVRATGLADRNRFYPVIKSEDAERVRRANKSSHFFERTAVILLLDPQ